MSFTSFIRRGGEGGIKHCGVPYLSGLGAGQRLGAKQCSRGLCSCTFVVSGAVRLTNDGTAVSHSHYQH